MVALHKLTQKYNYEIVVGTAAVLREYVFAHAARKYTKSHEWIEFNPAQKVAKIGISDHAQQQLGEIIHIEFPSVGKAFEQAQSALVIESVKIAADVYTPVTGKVVRVNSEVEKNPSLVNENAEDAWLVEVAYESEPADLLTAEDYRKSVHG
jgi:glycine cleavage system H protein